MSLQKDSSSNHQIVSNVAHTIDHATWLEVSKAAFDHNVVYYKNLIGAQNKLAAVIKGNGYGHGLIETAYLCEQNSFVDWLCVAQLSEALALDAVSKPILVLGYADSNPAYAVGKNIHFMVDSLEYADSLNEIGRKHGYLFNIHVKVDTGLSRMGFLPSDALFCIQQLQKRKYLTIVGVYSHFSASDSNPEFTQYQLEQFNVVLDILHKNKIAIENVHMSNSASIPKIEYPGSFNFFRLGLGLYGFGQQASQLQPVMTWKTRIMNIKTVHADSYISYAGTYKTTRTTRIALLPIGYYDGYDLRYSNKTSVIINGLYAPVIGRIAMNITIIDVTDISAHIGDEVIIMGAFSGIGIHDLANIADIKNVREILTGINPTIVRIIT